MNRFFLFILGWMSVGVALGGTRIDIQNSDGGEHRLMIEGKKIRIESEGESGYLLMDAAEKKLYAVNTVERQVIDMSSLYAIASVLNSPGKPSSLNISYEKKDAGPAIAGYATVHYKIKANGEACNDEYLAPDLLGMEDIKTFFEALKNIAEPGLGLNGRPDRKEDICDVVDFTVNYGQYAALGVPMRIFDKDGNLEHEITHVSKGVVFPAFTFDPPQGYNFISFDELQKAIKEKMDEITPEEPARNGARPSSEQKP